MAPKAQRLDSCDLNANIEGNHDLCKQEKENLITRKQGFEDNILSSSSSFLNGSLTNQTVSSKLSFKIILNALSNSITNAASPAMVGMMVAMPIAVRYPILQLVMFLTIVTGTSPLYFMLITILNRTNKCNFKSIAQNNTSQQHRPQPSIVGSIIPKALSSE